MAQTYSKSIEVPFQDAVVSQGGLLSYVWNNFFRNLYTLISHIGFETSFELVDNQTTAAPIEGLKFDPLKNQQIFIDYIIQRITGSSELIETGILAIVYKPKAATWSVSKLVTGVPDNAGITFSITSSGQLQYTSTDMAGTVYIQKVTYRTRTMAAKLVKPASGWT
jgi:hypothetical protein